MIENFKEIAVSSGLVVNLDISKVSYVPPTMFANENGGYEECSAIRLDITPAKSESKLYLNIYYGIGAKRGDSKISVLLSDNEIDFNDFPVYVYNYDYDCGSGSGSEPEIENFVKSLFLAQSDNEDIVNSIASALDNENYYSINLRINKFNPGLDEFNKLEELYFKVRDSMSNKLES